MKFPLIGSAVLFSLFLAFKFLPKELVNAVLSGTCQCRDGQEQVGGRTATQQEQRAGWQQGCGKR